MPNTEKFLSSPYNDLYIYYIQGCVNPDNEITGDDFIGNWQEDDFSFLFFSASSRNKVEKILETQPELILLDQFNMTYEEWQGGRLTPFQIGNFCIIPPWEKKLSSSQQPTANSPMPLEIILDPGVVFGTGTHPTTHDCLELLEFLCYEEKIETVLDLGTGTGILALAAGKLGCKRTLGLDFNFLAAKTAKRNIELNQLDNRILIFQGKAEDFIDSPADLVIANIHYDVMKDLITSDGFLQKKWFILSGLLRSQARDITYKLSQLPVDILKSRERDNIWHTFMGRAKE